MYFITTIRLNVEGVDDQRPVGMFSNQALAHEAIVHNYNDIFEDGYYWYAAIIKIDEGIYPDQEEIQWYKYDCINKKVSMVKRPKLTYKTGGFTFRPYIIG